MFPNSFGMTTQRSPNNSAMNITADTSSDSPLIWILPKTNPNAIIRKRAKYEVCNSDSNIRYILKRFSNIV